VEANYECGHYYFSTAQDQSQQTSIYGSSDIFALAMFQRSAPTLLAYGGTYAKNADMKIENILPFAFPFGIGGLHTIRTVSGKTNRHGQVIPTRQHAKPWGHTQAAKHARRRYFAMLDFFGLNSLFMS
jgi:hypothetical protein